MGFIDAVPEPKVARICPALVPMRRRAAKLITSPPATPIAPAATRQQAVLRLAPDVAEGPQTSTETKVTDGCIATEATSRVGVAGWYEAAKSATHGQTLPKTSEDVTNADAKVRETGG